MVVKNLVINSYQVAVIETIKKLLSIKVSSIGTTPIYFGNLDKQSAYLYIFHAFILQYYQILLVEAPTLQVY